LLELPQATTKERQANQPILKFIFFMIEK
jgi:hypothetical protein